MSGRRRLSIALGLVALPTLVAGGCGGDPHLKKLERTRLGVSLGRPTAVQVTNDGKSLVSLHRSVDENQHVSTPAQRENQVCFWDLESPAEPKRTVKIDGSLERPTISFDGKRLAGLIAGDGWGLVLRVWDLDSGLVLRDRRQEGPPRQDFWSGAFSHEGCAVLMDPAEGDKTELVFWDPVADRELRRLKIDGSGEGIAFARDGRSFLVFNSGGGRRYHTDNGALLDSMDLHDVFQGAVFEQGTFDNENNLKTGVGRHYLTDLHQAALSPDGSWVAFACLMQANISSQAGEFEFANPAASVWIYDWKKRELRRTPGIVRPTARAESLAVFPDASRFIVGIPSQRSTSESRLLQLEANSTLHICPLEETSPFSPPEEPSGASARLPTP